MTVIINGTNGITSVNGTAAAPSVTGTDTDTGIVYGTNTLSLATGGTTAVTVTSAQNTGFGTVGPNARVQIESTGNGLAVGANNFTPVASTMAQINASGNSSSENILILASLNAGIRLTFPASGGIQFPASQASSSDANTLDDYEEGTWTPVLGADAGQSGQSYNARAARYTKIGNICFVEFDAELSNKGTLSGSANISGLPFTCANTGDISQGGGSITYFANLGVSVVSIVPGPQPNQTYLYPRYLTAAATTMTPSSTASTFWANTTRIVGMCWYQVA